MLTGWVRVCLASQKTGRWLQRDLLTSEKLLSIVVSYRAVSISKCFWLVEVFWSVSSPIGHHHQRSGGKKKNKILLKDVGGRLSVLALTVGRQVDGAQDCAQLQSGWR
jgi:hypothetical protein